MSDVDCNIYTALCSPLAACARRFALGSPLTACARLFTLGSRRADRFIYFHTINVVDITYTHITIRPSDLGPVLEREYYGDHQIAYCQNYTVIAPMKNGELDGKLMAFDPFTHRLAWSCVYKRNVAHGELLYYDNDRVVVRCIIKSHDFLLEETAVECATCVLDD